MIECLKRAARMLLVVAPLTGGGLAFASEMPQDEQSLSKKPIETVTDELEDTRTEKQKARDKKLKELADSRKGEVSRVLVLRFTGTTTDYRTEALRRNIRNRIGRPTAKFYPEIDLYQSGRKHPDKTRTHRQQPGSVPDDTIFELEDAADEAAAIAWDALRPHEWQDLAENLRVLSDKVWFMDREELRQPLFRIYSQIGRAAENAHTQSPPYYEAVGGRNVNYYYYLAGTLALDAPDLLATISNRDLHRSIQNMKEQIEGGVFPLMTVSFADLDKFDADQFNKNYALWVNSKEYLMEDEGGAVELPLGRLDIYLERPDDGYGLSSQIILDKADDEYQFVVKDAREKMGKNFQNQLLKHRADCIPSLDGDILNYLAIYANLHPGEEIYITIPEGGSTSNAHLLVWHWDPDQQLLMKVLDTTGGFPVRFAALLGTGMTFSGVDVTEPAPERLVDPAQLPKDNDTQAFISAIDFDAQFTPESVPIKYQLRGHYNRFMFGIGLEYAFGLSGEKYSDYYQLKDDNGDDGPLAGPPQEICETADDWIPAVDGQCAEGVYKKYPGMALKERNPRRFMYALLGAMLGPDASEGFGPRGFVRFGFMNVPHFLDLSLHGGYTGRLFGKKVEGKKSDFDRIDRVRVIADADFWGGMLMGYAQSQFKGKDGFMSVGKPAFNFGLTAMGGITF